MLPFREFPQLTDDNHEFTSEADVGYNCIAWVAGDTTRWWQPGVFWPNDVSRDDHGVGALENLFESLGYVECPDASLEVGYEKVAIYGAGFMYTRQLQKSIGAVLTKGGETRCFPV